uniref:Putative LAGLIDADG homing endonuclease n=1 Tax=Jenufa minuta TaxID=993092 RepID=A0A0S2LNI9_JENMI|nr:putative LAGLIDADG homing endonuclease [Jenufa minuta]ALO63004.1 putative LAGLIDADG homing endonuclease [Jenufa minuta]
MTIMNIGSSETTRETPLINFDFTEFMQNAVPSHIKNIDQHYLEWLVGFIEGDGTFYFRKDNKNVRLGFEISQKDPKVLFQIKKTLGFGSVIMSKKANYWLYKVDDKKNFQRIILLLNGNLVLTKRYVQFNNWIEMAKKKDYLPLNFQNKQIKRQVSTKTAWLSGFIDAEGCFYANVSTSAPRSPLTFSIKQKMHITQKNEYDEKQTLETIGKLFFSKSKVHRANENFSYRIELSSLNSHQQIRNYLSRFKLKTNKYISFCRWLRILTVREKHDHLIEANLSKLQRLCSVINNDSKELLEKHKNITD